MSTTFGDAFVSWIIEVFQRTHHCITDDIAQLVFIGQSKQTYC